MKIKSYDKMIWVNGEQERVAQTSYIFSNGYIIRKCIDEALSYLKDKLNINLKENIINKIIKKERA